MSRYLPIDGLVNTRDLGGLERRDGSRTAFGRLYRGESPHRLDLHGRNALAERGIRTVIDLRFPEERSYLPNPVHQDLRFAYRAVALRSDDPADAEIRDLGRYYCHLLNAAQQPIAEVCRLIAAADEPLLFHCRVGKDRTGIIAALLLANAGVTDQAVIDDYCETEPRIVPIFDELMGERPAGAEAEDYAPLLAAPAQAMEQTLHHLSTHYGTAGDYLNRIGLRNTEIDRLQQLLS
jgi:protein-tyrosine phosphatase